MLTGAVAAGGVIVALAAPAGATPTSTEGNCLLNVTPVATAPTDPTTTNITVTWTDQCTNVSSYAIERSSDGTTWTTITTSPTVTSVQGKPNQAGTYTDSPGACGAYLYRVDAVHTPGQSGNVKVSISKNSNTVTLTSYDPSALTGNSSCTSGGPSGQGLGDCAQLSTAYGLGYYTNKNGAKVATAWLSSVNQLTLVDGSGNPVTPFATYNAFKSWLINATAKNMSYMVSAQLVTLDLNIWSGTVDGQSVLCDGGTATGQTVQSVATAAATFVSWNPVVGPGDPLRVDGDALETTMDEINSNLVSLASSS